MRRYPFLPLLLPRPQRHRHFAGLEPEPHHPLAPDGHATAPDSTGLGPSGSLALQHARRRGRGEAILPLGGKPHRPMASLPEWREL
jgi:hypothetical protein